MLHNQIINYSRIYVYFKDTSANTPVDRVDLFNTYFHSVYQPEDAEALNTFDFTSLVPPSLQLKEVTVNEGDVCRLLSSLDPSKAMGIDAIGPRLLK